MDIDSDFKKDIRERCIEYCAKKYGEDNICRIMTKTYQSSKGSIRLAARFLGAKEYADIIRNNDNDIDEKESNKLKADIAKKWEKTGDKLCKFIDNNQIEATGDTVIVQMDFDEDSDGFEDGEIEEEEIIDDGSIKSLLINPEFNKEEKRLIKLSDNINGIFTATGEHACGVIISKNRIDDVIPLMHNKKMDNFSTQCTMAQAEAKGLLKMDFLGLKNLDIITNVLKSTDDDKLQDYSIREKILNDPNIFKSIYCSGKTLGIFQFESPGMTKLLTELQPDCFEDIIAAISLYRPGPMDFIPQYIEGKHHPEAVVYKCDKLKEILSPTYGVIVYQEQVMQIFQGVGYTLGGADAIRKAMGKKHVEEIEAERDNFIYGNAERNIKGAIECYGMTEKEATEFFDTMVKFGKYAFNKSHATAYATVSLFTAYLKTYHPCDFYKETLKLLGTEKRKKQMDSYVKEMKSFGITMKAPDILKGNMKFETSEDKKSLYFGLSEGKNMSDFDITLKTDCLQAFVQGNPQVNQTTLISLAKLGCFKTLWINDKEECSRKQAAEWIYVNKAKYDKMLTCKNDYRHLKLEFDKETDIKQKKALAKKALGKKDTITALLNEIRADYDESKFVAPKEDNRLLNYQTEKELCYTYLSTEKDAEILKNYKGGNTNTFEDLANTGYPINITAVVLGVSNERKTKSSNKPYYNVDLLDRNGNIRTVRFASKPEAIAGIFRIPPQPFFNAELSAKLDLSKKKYEHYDLNGLINGIINNKIDINRVNPLSVSEKIDTIEVER